MRYTKEQTFSISKLMVEALYIEKTVDEAMEQVFSKEVGMYRNFKQNIKNLEKLLNGGIVHLATSCNLAEAHYFHLKGSDKIKFLDAMDKQIEYDATYGTPSHKLKKWIDTQRKPFYKD